jgi:pyruvate formate lyase activating enzyme
MGKQITADEVFKDVNSDAIFYQRSGGGITLSGGDPLAQPDFSFSILEQCKKSGLQTAIETSGFAKWDIFKEILEKVDIVLYDLKCMDAAEHKKYTGVTNEIILENARRIIKEFPHIVFVARMPIIPGFNDSQKNVVATSNFISGFGTSITVHLLPYHRLGETKYERLEKPEKVVRVEPPSEEHMEEIRKIFESFGLIAVIGG